MMVQTAVFVVCMESHELHLVQKSLLHSAKLLVAFSAVMPTMLSSQLSL